MSDASPGRLAATRDVVEMLAGRTMEGAPV